MSDTTELRTDAAVDSKTTTGASGAEAGEAAPTGASSRPRAASRGTGLAALKLPELQKLASSLGITGTGRMRKSDVIAAIEAKQGGPVSSPAKAKSAKNAETVPKAGKVEATDGQTEAQVPNTSGTDEAPRKRVAEQPSDQAVTDTQGGRGDKPPRGRRSSRRRGDEPGEQTRSVDGTDSTTSASSVTKTSSTPRRTAPTPPRTVTPGPDRVASASATAATATGAATTRTPAATPSRAEVARTRAGVVVATTTTSAADAAADVAATGATDADAAGPSRSRSR